MFPLTLQYAKLRLQIPSEATDQDKLLIDSIEVAKHVLEQHILASTVNNPPPYARLRVREAGLLIAQELVLGGELHLYTPRVGQEPVWLTLLAHELEEAQQATIDGEPEEEPTMSIYEQVKAILTASDGISVIPDDDAEKIRLAPTSTTDFVRKIGWSGNTAITEAIVATAPQPASMSNQVVVPANTAPAHIWVWMANPGATLDRVLVDRADARAQFGDRAELTVNGVLGALWVTTGLQVPSAWVGKTVTLE